MLRCDRSKWLSISLLMIVKSNADKKPNLARSILSTKNTAGSAVSMDIPPWITPSVFSGHCRR
jgi:hypothetical protein